MQAYNKLYVALVMSFLAILSSHGIVFPEWFDEAYVTTVFMALNPVLVYFTPNRA